MSKIKTLEKLDVPTESNFMLWVKRIAYIVTIITTLSGGVLGFLSYLREIRDPKAQAGYSEHSKMLKENSENIRENRSEIRYIYRSMIEAKNNPDVVIRDKEIPDTPIQRPMDWNKLPIQKMRK